MRKAQYWLERKIQNLAKWHVEENETVKGKKCIWTKSGLACCSFLRCLRFLYATKTHHYMLLPCTTVSSKQLSTDVWYLHTSFNIWECVVGGLDNVTAQKLCIQCSDSNTGRCRRTLRLINCVPQHISVVSTFAIKCCL